MNTDKIIVEGYIWKSQQNGGVFNPEEISPAVCCGAHTGCQPKIIEYDTEEDNLCGDN